MVLIQVKPEDKEKVLELLLTNGKFRALGENKFDIIENSEDVLKKLKANKIGVERIES